MDAGTILYLGRRAVPATKDPEEQLASFLEKFLPDVAAQAEAIRNVMRRRYPTANELVYDNYNALAIGFGPSERTGEVIFSVAVYPRWVSLFFFQGKALPDPERRLQGSGNQARHIRIDSLDVFDDPAVQTLMEDAVARAAVPFDPHNRHQLIIKSVSARQRPRRPDHAAAAPKIKPRSAKPATRSTLRRG
jgi:hypothetical protein